MQPWKRLTCVKRLLDEIDMDIHTAMYVPRLLVDHLPAMRKDGLEYRMEGTTPVMLYAEEEGDDALALFFELEEEEIQDLFGDPTSPLSIAQTLSKLANW